MSNRVHPAAADNDSLVRLPRGGIVVETAIGPIQFGVPPETIKDSLTAKRPVPTVYVLPTEPFKRAIGPSQGLNVAECEFPCYFNFFVLRKRVRLVVPSEDAERRLRDVFQETLFGPRHPKPSADYHKSVPEHARANLEAESRYFRHFGDTYLELDMLIEFVHFDSAGVAVVSEVKDGAQRHVRILRAGSYYAVEAVEQGADATKPGKQIAAVPDNVELPAGSERFTVPSSVFKPPLFGVTVLGASHGFDATESTSGYVIWVNGRGVMVDPPTNSTLVLQKNGIPPALIEAIILTHCHADHDAGTFQKILTEGKVTLITTPTIMASFVRKYGQSPPTLPGRLSHWWCGMVWRVVLGLVCALFGAGTLPCLVWTWSSS